MSKRNFDVERDGAVVKIWIDSGADVDNCMIAFTRECGSEIEASLLAESIECSISNEIVFAYDQGRRTEKSNWEDSAACDIADRAEQSKRFLESMINDIKEEGD